MRGVATTPTLVVFLPCESQQWPEDKKYFTLLSKIKTAYEFKSLVDSHSNDGTTTAVSLSQRIKCLQGLVVFLTNIASEEESEQFFSITLPFICRMASCLDVLIPDEGVPFVRQQEGLSVQLGRKLVLSLIANAFLCTFPHEHPLGIKNRKPFTFEKFYKVIGSGDYSRQCSQSAKLHCILNYFYRMSHHEEEGNPGIVTYTRQVVPLEQIPSLDDWRNSQYPLCPLIIDTQHSIEDMGSRNLQVDFAAAHIGGGTLGGGRVQEEIRFSICPELLVSILIMDCMEDNEAIIIEGYERFASYDGYGATLKYGGDYVDPSERDVFGNLNTSIVAINAVNFQGRFKPEEQYKEDMILREINKAFVGFWCRDERGDLCLDQVALHQGEYDEDDELNSTVAPMEDQEEEEEETKLTSNTGVQNFANDLVSNIFDNILLSPAHTTSPISPISPVSSPEVDSDSSSPSIREQLLIDAIVQDAVKDGIKMGIEKANVPTNKVPHPQSAPIKATPPTNEHTKLQSAFVKKVPVNKDDGPAKKKGQNLKAHNRRGSGPYSKTHSLCSTDGGSIDLLDPSYLHTSLSRMSIAWSTTSTRDDSSMPPSPTELDSIALRMVDNLDDYSSLVADLAIRGALLSLKQSQGLVNLMPHYDDVQKSKIDTFLHSLEEAGPIIENEKVMLPYSPRWYNIQKDTLRPVATGNWGCGAFKGDPQLKSLLQWMAVSSNGRPELKYCTFKDARMEELSGVLSALPSLNVTTVGSLCSLVLEYCHKRTIGDTSVPIFNYIINLKTK